MQAAADGTSAPLAAVGLLQRLDTSYVPSAVSQIAVSTFCPSENAPPGTQANVALLAAEAAEGVDDDGVGNEQQRETSAD